jgi:hypothetical protein
LTIGFVAGGAVGMLAGAMLAALKCKDHDSAD